MNKAKKITFFMVVALFLCAFPILLLTSDGYVALASTPKTEVTTLGMSSSTKYFDLSSGENIALSGGNILIANADNTMHKFNIATKEITTGIYPNASTNFATFGDNIVSLENDGIKIWLNDALVATYSASGIIDFSIYGSFFAVATNNKIEILEFDGSAFSLKKTINHTYQLNKLILHDNTLYTIVEDSYNRNVNNLLKWSADFKTTYILQEDLPTITAFTCDEANMYLSAPNVILYQPFSSNILSKVYLEKYTASSLSAKGNKIYFLDKSLCALLEFDTDTKQFSPLLLSSSDELGFYNRPNSTITKKNKIITSDKRNNRLQINTNGIYSIVSYNTLHRPTAVALNSSNELYIAHSNNIIDKLDSDYTLISSEKLNEDSIIENIGINNHNQLFVFDSVSNSIYLSTDSGYKKIYTTASHKIISFKVFDNDTIYILLNDKVISLDYIDAWTPTDILSYTGVSQDIAVDVMKNVFLLKADGNIDRHAHENYNLTISTDYAEFNKVNPNAKSLAISSIDNDIVDFGDIIITDTASHSIKKISATALDVGVLDIKNFKHPVDVTTASPDSFSTDKIIFSLKGETELFDLPIDMIRSFLIPKTAKIILLADNVNGYEGYSYVMVDDNISSKARTGYIFTDRLGEQDEYTEPPSTFCIVYTPFAPIYRYPSMYAQKLTNYEHTPKGAKFTLLTWAHSYSAQPNITWKRISLEGGYHGYILSSNITIRNYEPNSERPQTNAVIESDNPGGAILYTLNDKGEYIPIDDELPIRNQTAVQVVGAFDSSKPYTKIKYFDKDLGILECFVETRYVKYQGVNLVVVAAIILIVVSLSFLVVLLVRIKRKPNTPSIK